MQLISYSGLGVNIINIEKLNKKSKQSKLEKNFYLHDTWESFDRGLIILFYSRTFRVEFIYYSKKFLIHYNEFRWENKWNLPHTFFTQRSL